MSVSFSTSAAVVQPLTIDGWASVRRARNVTQDVMGGGTDALLYPAAPRSGTLTAVFLSLADALALEVMLAGTEAILYGDSDKPALAMTFVATDDIQVNEGDDPILLTDGTEAYAYSVVFSFQQVAT